MVTRVRRGAKAPEVQKEPEAIPEPKKAPPIRRRQPVKAAPVEETEPAQPIVQKRDPTSSSRVNYDAIIVRYKERATSPKNAIRAFCVECMGGMIAEVDRCTSLKCSLYPFRMGKNPYHKLSKHNRVEDDDTDS